MLDAAAAEAASAPPEAAPPAVPVVATPFPGIGAIRARRPCRNAGGVTGAGSESDGRGGCISEEETMMRTFTIDDPHVCAGPGTRSIPRGQRGRLRRPQRAERRIRQRRAPTAGGPYARRLVACGAVAVCISAVAAGCDASTPLAASPSQRSVARKAATPAEAKLDSRLLAAVDRLRAGAAPFSARDALEVDAEQRVLVDMRAAVTPDLLDAIGAGGGVVVSRFPRYDAIRAWGAGRGVDPSRRAGRRTGYPTGGPGGDAIASVHGRCDVRGTRRGADAGFACAAGGGRRVGGGHLRRPPGAGGARPKMRRWSCRRRGA